MNLIAVKALLWLFVLIVECTSIHFVFKRGC